MQRIKRIFQEYFATTKEVLSLFRGGRYVSTINQNIDSRMNEFREWFNDTEQFSSIYREFEQDLELEETNA